MLLRASGAVERLCSGGPPLGILVDPDYQEGTSSLAPGDLLVVFTDGVTEAADASEMEFGEERLTGVVRGAAALPTREVCQRILDAVAAFEAGGDQYDDITVVAARTTR
jgi:sigma-B regulation protein RsbU (phosphoserine phosphatase)